MNILITGGAGFIGHNVVRCLEREGHTCTIIDNSTDYGFIPEVEHNFLYQERSRRLDKKINLIDIRDQNQVNAVFDTHKIDTVIHMASFPRQKVVADNPIVGSDVMITGLINLMEISRKHNVKKFVYISSSMVYGDFDNDVTETADCHPIGQYGIMKYMGERLVEDYHRLGYFDHVIIRPSAVYGEWDVEDRVVSKFMIGACKGETLKVRGPNEMLDFTYVEDTAKGIALAATLDKANNNTYNITRSSEKTYTLLEAANLIVDIAGKGSVEVYDRDLAFPRRGRLSISNAKRDLGFNPKINVEDGFQRYYNWYQEYSHLWNNK